MTRKHSRLVRRLWQATLLTLAIWVTGLAVFAFTLPAARSINDLPTADGIVVLTGGGGRLNTGLDLLVQKKGSRLLVSGVHHSVPKKDLRNLTNAPDHLFQCCVDLDRASANTADNARKSAEWARDNAFKSLYLVTADYHMRRSVLLLEEALPDCEILPHPVNASISLQGMVIEYSKFVVTYAQSVLPV